MKHHFTQLEQAYSAVGARTWLAPDFVASNLEVSRCLFTPESLNARQPRPKALEVYALLSGLPFAADFTDPLIHVQQQISAVLGPALHYWVAPQNLGVEYCVFKWPTETWNPQWLGPIRNALQGLRFPAFRYCIQGVQINPDGCVVARGFDEGGVLFRIRKQLKAELPFLSAKQSAWAHVPLGRILEPLGAERFAQLGALVDAMTHTQIAATQIATLQLIHETRWYMEERTTLDQYVLNALPDAALSEVTQ